MSERTQKQAAIKRASLESQKAANQLDGESREQLRNLWLAILNDLKTVLETHGSVDGQLRIETLAQIKQQAELIFNAAINSQTAMIDAAMLSSATLGAQPFSGAIGFSEYQIPQKTVAVVRAFMADDGLQLSDRIWGNAEEAKAIFNKRVTAAVIQGQSASEAAINLVRENLPISKDIELKQQSASAKNVFKDIKTQLFDGPYYNMRRVFRTEINRAHGTAFEAAVSSHPDTVGTQFLLSPNHPKVDICDMHARVNRFGLGKGVYPIDKNPWHAHPDTLSYTQVVFSDEITKQDKENKTDRITFLKAKSKPYQVAVLGKKKTLALELGYLKENEINTPWKDLEKRYARRGYDLTHFN